jgi:acyl dehydratase
VAIYQGLAREPADDPGAVPDLLPLCLSIGLGWRAPQPPLVVLAFMGLDYQVLRPLRVGDTIHGRSRIAAKRPLREDGVVVEEREVIDQRGEVVQRGRFTYLVARREKETRA